MFLHAWRLTFPHPEVEGETVDAESPLPDDLAEVLDRLDPALREFLLATSVLPELTASRCAAVSGDRRSAEHLEPATADH